MRGIDPTDPEWPLLRTAFDAFVDASADQRSDEQLLSSLSPTLLEKLQRLLKADSSPEPLLVPGRPIEIPGEEPPSLVAPPPNLPRRLGRYQLVSSIGKGGMGEVFRAWDTLLERDVAVKVLSPQLLTDPQWLPRFRREARAAGGLNHPNVLTVHDVAEFEGEHFLVTELVEGETLRDRLAQGPLSWSELLDHGCQIVGAVAAAHAAEIVHRDLKPENVMVRRDGLLKVLDFGLAKSAPSALSRESGLHTQAGLLVGTIRYMSPEQARGDRVDARSDVFGLGALLYEMATGEPAFAGRTALDVLVALLDRDPPSPALRRPDLPPAFSRIVREAMQKDRLTRTQSAAALLQALDSLRTPAAAPAAEDVPEVHYTRSGDADIAYQVIGSGPIDLVFVMGWISHLEWFWREPSFARFLRQLAQFARVILFDKRGTGLSDRVSNDRLPTLEQRMEDVRAVMDQVGSRNAVLCGVSEGGPMCALFAATYPERTQGLVMIGSYARRLRSDDYPWGSTPESRERFCEDIMRNWGSPVGIAERAPSKAEDKAFRDWWAAYLRHGASPNAAVALTRMNAEIDIRPVLATIAVPTLVIHRTGDRCLKVEEGRYLAKCIPSARLVELPGDDHLPFVGDQDAILRSIERFLAEVPPPAATDRVLATLVRVRADAHAATDSVAAWRLLVLREGLLGTARSIVISDRELLAVFDGPVRAIHAAREVLQVTHGHGVAIVIAVHTGECVRQPHGVAGPVIEESLALLDAAAAGMIVASGATRDLVPGAGISFRRLEQTEAVGGNQPMWSVEG